MQLKYMVEPFLYEDTAVVNEILQQDGVDIVVLEETIFYPKGGGQPADTGIMKQNKLNFVVEDVKFVDGKVHHIGKFSDGKFTVGQVVNLSIDKEKRILHNKIHTLGHLLDEAVLNLGYTHIKPTKGYHYPEGPSVDYEGHIEDIEKFSTEVAKETIKLINEGYEVKAFFATVEDLPKYCHMPNPQPSNANEITSEQNEETEVDATGKVILRKKYAPKTDFNYPQDKPIRVVMVYGNKGTPCGGTHVANIKEIGGVIIRKVSSKKGVVRLSYAVA